MPRPHPALFAAVLTLTSAVSVRAQVRLLARVGDQLAPVVDAVKQDPVAFVDGKLQKLKEPAFKFVPDQEYLPAFVYFHSVSVTDHTVDHDGVPMDHYFEFQSTVESLVPLDHVFVVLDLHLDGQNRSLFVQQIGTLLPRHAVYVGVSCPIYKGFHGVYVPHIFSGGREVLTSFQPKLARERALDQMVARRTAGVQTAAPRPFVGPPPFYPAAMIKSKAAGRVILHFRIAKNGSVQDAEVKSAPSPALGDVGLETIREWRFLPRIQNGQPVDTLVDMPFDLTPPPPPS